MYNVPLSDPPPILSHIFTPSFLTSPVSTHCRSSLALIVYHPCHLWLMNISHSYNSAAIFPCLHTIVLLALSTAAKSYSPLLSCLSLTPWSCSRSDSSQSFPHLLLKSSDSFHVIFYYLSALCLCLFHHLQMQKCPQSSALPMILSKYISKSAVFL